MNLSQPISAAQRLGFSGLVCCEELRIAQKRGNTGRFPQITERSWPAGGSGRGQGGGSRRSCMAVFNERSFSSKWLSGGNQIPVMGTLLEETAVFSRPWEYVQRPGPSPLGVAWALGPGPPSPAPPPRRGCP